MVGVSVGVTVGSTMNGVTVEEGSVVAVTGTGDGVAEAPPRGVGVAYCPQSDAFPAQEASSKEAAVIRPICRFTNKSVGRIIPVDYLAI
jgi:hypothetical protein